MPLPFFQLPLHVPDIFSVCPLHFPCMCRSCVASHFPTSPVVPIGFLVLCFPFIPPALPLFSFLSLSCPFHFPLLSCHVDFLFPPLISLHFLAFPLCSPVFPANKTRFFQRFRKEDVQKHRVFLRLVERHQIAARYVGDPPQKPTYQTSGGGGERGGGYPLSSSKYPTRRTMSANIGVRVLLWVARCGWRRVERLARRLDRMVCRESKVMPSHRNQRRGSGNATNGPKSAQDWAKSGSILICRSK